MEIYAIGDLHLPGGDDKPMNVFGTHWEGHFQKISADWEKRVKPDDLVLIPGDISWAMQIENALPDLQQIGALPGRKVILRGNHDYWWCGISRLRELLPPGMYALQNDALLLDDVVLCGTRGWTYGSDAAEDKKIYARETLRMKLSLDWAQKHAGKRLIAMTHYPPLGDKGEETPLSQLLSQYRVDDAVYGHLHGGALRSAVTGLYGGVRYHCVSCDGLGFQLYHLPTGKVENQPK